MNIASTLMRMKKSKTPVGLYYKSILGFNAGLVREADVDFCILELISPVGKFDGYMCISVDEIIKVDVGTDYLLNLAKVYRYYGEQPPALLLGPGELLMEFVDFVIKSKRICSMEVGMDSLDKLTGYMTERDWNYIELQILNEDGYRKGSTIFDLEDILCVYTDSEYEKYMEVLSALNGKFDARKKPSAKEEKKAEKKNEDEHVLPFPGK